MHRHQIYNQNQLLYQRQASAAASVAADQLQQSSHHHHLATTPHIPYYYLNSNPGQAPLKKAPLPSPYYSPAAAVAGGGLPHLLPKAAPIMDGGHNPMRLNTGVTSIIYEDSNSGSHLVNVHRADLYQKCNRGSHSSDTSSAYSGSDTMTSIHSSTIDPDEMIDLSGLVESVVDSDEEDLAESMDVSYFGLYPFKRFS